MDLEEILESSVKILKRLRPKIAFSPGVHDDEILSCRTRRSACQIFFDNGFSGTDIE